LYFYFLLKLSFIKHSNFVTHFNFSPIFILHFHFNFQFLNFSFIYYFNSNLPKFFIINPIFILTNFFLIFLLMLQKIQIVFDFYFYYMHIFLNHGHFYYSVHLFTIKLLFFLILISNEGFNVNCLHFRSPAHVLAV